MGARCYYGVMIADGLALSGLGLIGYFALVTLWSAIVAYVVTFANEPVSGHGSVVPVSVAAHGPVTSAHGPAPVEATRAKPYRGFSPYEGFKSYATGETVTVEDIVKGLARESGALALHNAQTMHEVPKVQEPHRPASSAQANAFLDMLVQGERDATFDMLRDIEEHGEGAEPFLRRVLGAIESALEARIGGATCDLRVMEILGNCETPALEKLVHALSTVETGKKQSGKLALTRAFGALKP